MPRKPRLQTEGMVHHVIVRGNKKQNIFASDPDRIRYLHLIDRYKQRYGFRLYAYCLMDNHVHLLLQQGIVSLSRIMQGIQQSYTQFHNRKYSTPGHVFEQRFKSFPCSEDAYLIALVAYIHKNPKSAGLVESAAQYRWSSHHEIMQPHPDHLTDTEELAQLLGISMTKLAQEYLGWINEIEEDDVKKQYMSPDEREQQRASADFQRLEEKIRKKRCSSFDVRKAIRQYEEEIGFAVTVADFRRLFTILCDRHTVEKGSEIAEELGLKPSRISSIRKEFSDRQWSEDLLFHLDGIDKLMDC